MGRGRGQYGGRSVLLSKTGGLNRRGGMSESSFFPEATEILQVLEDSETDADFFSYLVDGIENDQAFLGVDEEKLLADPVISAVFDKAVKGRSEFIREEYWGSEGKALYAKHFILSLKDLADTGRPVFIDQPLFDLDSGAYDYDGDRFSDVEVTRNFLDKIFEDFDYEYICSTILPSYKSVKETDGISSRAITQSNLEDRFADRFKKNPYVEIEGTRLRTTTAYFLEIYNRIDKANTKLTEQVAIPLDRIEKNAHDRWRSTVQSYFRDTRMPSKAELLRDYDNIQESAVHSYIAAAISDDRRKKQFGQSAHSLISYALGRDGAQTILKRMNVFLKKSPEKHDEFNDLINKNKMVLSEILSHQDIMNVTYPFSQAYREELKNGPVPEGKLVASADVLIESLQALIDRKSEGTNG